MAKFTFIDLFAGIGGFHKALEDIGGQCLGYSEIAPDAIKAYCDNYHVRREDNLGDITQLKSLPAHDLMTAGVPCQSWSIAGKNLGFDDDRGQLWNDALYLLNQARPKAFIFENVKGLADPRNRKALDYIMRRIKDAGYHAKRFLLNAYDYGVPQTRVRIYIVGFKEEKYLERFRLPSPHPGTVHLDDVLDIERNCIGSAVPVPTTERKARWSLSCNAMGFNDYFLFNDLRNGPTTIHSWDITETTERQKAICCLLLKNRRKGIYGILDGNALSIKHFQELDHTITQDELEELVNMGILKHIPYLYEIVRHDCNGLTANDHFLLAHNDGNIIMVDKLKKDKEFRKRKIDITETLRHLEETGVTMCIETRFDFKNGKISTGLNGINRIFLPSSKIYPTLVASDTNDYVATENIEGSTPKEWKDNFLEKIYHPHKYRQITKTEACRIQGFPADFELPQNRQRWMKLIGNSIAVPVVRMLAKAIVNTGVFAESDRRETERNITIQRLHPTQLELFA